MRIAERLQRDGRTIFAHLLLQTALNTVAASILLLKQCCVKMSFAVKLTKKSPGGEVSTRAFREEGLKFYPRRRVPPVVRWGWTFSCFFK